jgi:hypothetical protein
MLRKPTVEERFWGKVDKSSDCWIWTACRTPKGYGHFRANGKQVQVHRWSYQLHYGPIPEGLEIDHICRVRACVNPSHLRAVTHQENISTGARRIGISGVRGVYWDNHNQRWRVQIKRNGKMVYLGSCKDLEDAKVLLAAHCEPVNA